MSAMLQPDGSVDLPEIDPRIFEMHSRRRTTWDNPMQTIKNVQDKHRQVCRLTATGLPQEDVAAITGYSKQSVTRIVNNASTAEYMQALRLEGDQQVMEAKRLLSEEAIEVARMMAEAAKDESIPWRDRRHLMDSVLDRAGVSRQSESKNTSIEHKHIGIEHIRKLAEGTADNVNVRAAIEAHFTPVEQSAPAEQLEIDFVASPERFTDPLLAAVCSVEPEES